VVATAVSPIDGGDQACLSRYGPSLHAVGQAQRAVRGVPDVRCARSGDTFTIAQLATAIRALPADGLRESAQALVRALEGAGDQREDYWRNRVLPFWERIWPKSNDQASDANAESLARLCIAAGGEFPSAMAAVGNRLRVVQRPDYVIHRLQESGLSSRSPEDALRLLFTILGDQPSWLPPELRQCLDAIGQVNPNLRQDHRFMRVDELARRFGI
jgi:hypothetical protein